MIPSITGCLLASALAVSAQAAEVTNTIGMRFVEIPAGEFIMGTRDLDEALMDMPDPRRSRIADEAPAHRVRITRPFLLGLTEVTQGQWLGVMQNRPGPAEYWQRDDWAELPVVGVSWPMARRFARELGKLDPAHRYRLPSEAEWEYAARAGDQSLRPSGSDDVEDVAWFIHNSGDEPQPVAGLRPNAFGLYDMLGNAWEWTRDWYAPETYAGGPSEDPRGPETGWKKVRRGGSYHCPLHMVRFAYRAADDPDSRYSVLGFRLVAEPR